MIAPLLPFVGTAAFLGASARWNWWRLRKEGLKVLMYHKVGDPPPGSQLRKLWVGAEEFRWQMEYLLRNDFAPMLFREVEEVRLGERPMPKNPVLVTFDDGYANNYELAYPILKDLSVKANIFLVVETLDRYNEWHNPDTEPWMRMLTWSQVSEMLGSGLIDVGSHTMRHRHLPSLTPEEVRWEIFESKKRLEERLDRSVPAFAYPYGAGAYVPSVRAAAVEAYAFDFGIRQGVSPWPWRPEDGPLRRLFIRRDDNRFDFHLQITRGKNRF